MNRLTAAPHHVAGLSALRGLCALLVACYHLLRFTGITSIHSIGLYGVYAFFVVSGASLVIAYRHRFQAGFSPVYFLYLRLVRLAPLLLFCLALHFVVVDFAHPQNLTTYLLNSTFLFGMGNPGSTSILTGGWSLGIEFCFYLCFPVVLALSAHRYRLAFLGGILLCQLGFINNAILPNQPLSASWVLFTQPLSFAGYFFAGAVMGHLYLDERIKLNNVSVFAVLLFMGALIMGSYGASEVGTLTGVRGVMLTGVTIALVYFSLGMKLSGPASAVATFLGDISYGLYLLHPIVFEMVRPYAPHSGVLIATVLLVSITLAYISETYLEAPLRAKVRRAKSNQESNVVPFRKIS